MKVNSNSGSSCIELPPATASWRWLEPFTFICQGRPLLILSSSLPSSTSRPSHLDACLIIELPSIPRLEKSLINVRRRSSSQHQCTQLHVIRDSVHKYLRIGFIPSWHLLTLRSLRGLEAYMWFQQTNLRLHHPASIILNGELDSAYPRARGNRRENFVPLIETETLSFSDAEICSRLRCSRLASIGNTIASTSKSQRLFNR